MQTASESMSPMESVPPEKLHLQCPVLLLRNEAFIDACLTDFPGKMRWPRRNVSPAASASIALSTLQNALLRSNQAFYTSGGGCTGGCTSGLSFCAPNWYQHNMSRLPPKQSVNVIEKQLCCICQLATVSAQCDFARRCYTM